MADLNCSQKHSRSRLPKYRCAQTAPDPRRSRSQTFTIPGLSREVTLLQYFLFVRLSLNNTGDNSRLLWHNATKAAWPREPRMSGLRNLF